MGRYETFRDGLVGEWGSVGGGLVVLCWGSGIGIGGDDRMVMWGWAGLIGVETEVKN